MQCFMKKEIDLEIFETTGECCKLPSVRSWCTFIRMKHISPTFMYIYHTNVFEADNIYKNPPQM